MKNDAMRGAIHRRWLYVVLYVMPWLPLVTQCAARASALTSAQLADAGRAEALMRDGCYACLREADGIYARLIQSSARKTPGACCVARSTRPCCSRCERRNSACP